MSAAQTRKAPLESQNYRIPRMAVPTCVMQRLLCALNKLNARKTSQSTLKKSFYSHPVSFFGSCRMQTLPQNAVSFFMSSIFFACSENSAMNSCGHPCLRNFFSTASLMEALPRALYLFSLTVMFVCFNIGILL